MKNIIATNANNWQALFARLAIAITIFPHGAQKLLGWYGGGGFNGTMDFFTHGAGLPWIIGFLVIIIEFFGSLLLVLGLATRLAAFAIAVNFTGVLFSAILANGFFMNWSMQGGKGEGIEYFILLFGLIMISLISGGGKASIDAALSNKKPRVNLA
ncbi:MAG TPA: DoxX family protein [Chitinophagaceae bacterium]|jgi:putative oxidoreductase|nr:DoxX family protein [Chitinophagaceae bacterium]